MDVAKDGRPDEREQRKAKWRDQKRRRRGALHLLGKPPVRGHPQHPQMQWAPRPAGVDPDFEDLGGD